MKFYISTTGIKRVTISNESDSLESTTAMMKGKGIPVNTTATTGSRRISYRSVLPAVLVLGIVLPFVFVRIAFLALECSSSVDCVGMRFFGRSDTTLLGDEITRALIEAEEDETYGKEGKEESSLNTLDDLVKDVTSERQDIKAFAFKTKAMLLKMERKVQLAKQRETEFWHLASHGVPTILHCLSLKLAEEYAVNAKARSRLPPPEYVSRLTNPSFHHVVLFTDNVLAASVVVSSTIKNSGSPEKLVFHIVTDKKSYTPMHAWFATNSVKLALVEVKGLHQFDWSHDVNIGVKEMLEIHHLIWRHFFDDLRKDDVKYEEGHVTKLDALSQSLLSLLNYLHMYIPEMFPDLKKILFLDDDIVVQRDLSSLWDIDMKGKVVNAVVNAWCGDNCCPGRTYKDYFNFTNPLILSNFDPDRCGWLYGMSIFDLHAWRRSSITKTYHQWLKLNLNSGFGLWNPGILPPTLMAFEGHVHPIDPSYHVAGLGQRTLEISQEKLEAAAVVHFSGPAKPWLEIGLPEVRSLWSTHVNTSNKFIRRCLVMG